MVPSPLLTRVESCLVDGLEGGVGDFPGHQSQGVQDHTGAGDALEGLDVCTALIAAHTHFIAADNRIEDRSASLVYMVIYFMFSAGDSMEVLGVQSSPHSCKLQNRS